MSSSSLGGLPPISSSDEGLSTEFLNFASRLEHQLEQTSMETSDIALFGTQSVLNTAESYQQTIRAMIDAGAIGATEGAAEIAAIEANLVKGRESQAMLKELYNRAASSTMDLFKSIGRKRDSIHSAVAEKAVETAKKVKQTAQAASDKARAIYDKDFKAFSDMTATIEQKEAAFKLQLQKPFDEAKLEQMSADIKQLNVELRPINARVQASNSIWEEAAADLKKFRSELIQIVKDSEQFKTATTIANEISKLAIGGDIAEVMHPISQIGKQLKRSWNLISKGYVSIADKAIEGDATYTEFLAEIKNVTQDELDIENTRVSKQLEELRNIFISTGSKEQLTKEVLAKTAQWMSPSWRYATAVYDDLESVIAKFDNLEFFSDYVSSIASAIAMVTRTIARGTLAGVFKGLEFVIGEALTTVLVDTGISVIEAIGTLTSMFLAPPIQAVILSVYLEMDAFKVHNFQQWANDFLSVFITASGVDSFPKLRIAEYPEFTQIVNPTSKEIQSPPKMWEIDHKQLKTVMDFWGKLFISETNRRGSKYPQYTPLPNYSGIWRLPGKYIDPNHHPHDPIERIDKCKQIEVSLDVGTLVDKNGLATGVDKGGNLSSNLIPRKKGLIRNLVDFPLYENTLVWPAREGSFVQTNGNLTRENIDPTLLKLWTGWARDGTWGTVYSAENATLGIKLKAAETNKIDFQQYMSADRNSPFAWHELKQWADGNAGKKTIVQQKMKGVTLELLEEEMKTDYPVKARSTFEKLMFPTENSELENQSTLDFVNMVFYKTGRYPYTPNARKFYQNVITNHKTWVIDYQQLTPDTFIDVVDDRKSSSAEILKFTSVVNEFELYIKSLKKTQGDTDASWKVAFKETLWKTYVLDTSPRTEWGYIVRNLNQFIAEIQMQTNIMLGKRKAKIWNEYMSRVAKVGIPLNTNRFHRLSFCARLNQLVYSEDVTTSKGIIKQIEEKGGKLLENRLITTGLSTKEEVSWVKGIAKVVFLPESASVDLPVFFGDLHCRIIIVPKPEITCFVVFRGTTNYWEWAIDLDFTAAAYGSISDNGQGKYKMNLHTKMDTPFNEFTDVIWGDPDNFALHRGFLRAWLVFKPMIMKQMDELYKKYEIKDVIVTGHSLGAGIAQIACLEFPSVPVKQSSTGASALALLGGLNAAPKVIMKRPHCYCYSSPAVGDDRFSWHFVNQTSESGHVYIDADLITLIPPILIPASDSWSGAIVMSVISDVKNLLEADGGDVGAAWIILSRVFKHFNLPFNPAQWKTGNAIDWGKIRNSLVKIMTAFGKHRAVRGGGVFLRLTATDSGAFTETSADPGSTAGGMSIFAHGVVGPSELEARHSLDNVTLAMDRVAAEHEDLFDTIDKTEHPQWGDAGTSKPDKPILNPPTAAVLKSIQRGKVIGITTTNKRYARYHQVSPEHIDHHDIVWLPDVEEIHRKQKRQQSRHKKRRVMEGEYHGY